ncbi:MAG TPA: hypothetical protein VG370_30815 [Chloroflexota bacterium]|nr:hypothetical protein [Chloroflexota bacterium]
MTGTETLTAPFVLGLAAAWVLWYIGGPLLRPRSSSLSLLGEGAPAEGWTGHGPPPGEDGAERFPERELQMVLAALRELERDRELGLVTAEEYAPLRDRHEARALALYREVDELAERRREAVASAVAREKAALVAANGTASRAAARVPLRAPAPAGGWAGRGEGVPAPRHDAVTPTSPRHPTRKRVPGTRHPERGQARRSRRLAIGSAAAAVVFLAGVGALWYSGSVGRGAQRPIATVRAPDYHVLAFDPVSPGRVFLGTHAGLFVSGDRGQGWRPVPTADGDVMAVVPVPQEGTRLLAAGHDVFLGSPDGSSWQPAQVTLPGTDVHALAASPAAPSRLYAAVVGHGMFRSDDAGRTWTRTGQMPPSIAALAVVPDGESDLLFAATAQEGVLASRDGGRGWGQASGFVNGALPTRQVTAIAYDGRSGDVGASQAGAFRGALFVATDRGVFRSTDGGSAWVRLGLEAEVAALAIAPDDPRTLLAVDTGGRVFRSADRGVTW